MAKVIIGQLFVTSRNILFDRDYFDGQYEFNELDETLTIAEDYEKSISSTEAYFMLQTSSMIMLDYNLFVFDDTAYFVRTNLAQCENLEKYVYLYHNSKFTKKGLEDD